MKNLIIKCAFWAALVIFFLIYFHQPIAKRIETSLIMYKGLAIIPPSQNVLSLEEKDKQKNQLASILKTNGEYFSKGIEGEVSFDYSNNDGIYTIGEEDYRFDTQWSKASDEYIHFYNDQANIKSVRLAKDVNSLDEVRPENYNPSSRARTAGIDQVAIFENVYGKFLAIKILEIKDDTRGDNTDKLRFEYKILDR